MMTRVTAFARAVLRAPFQPWAWRELAYALTGTVLAALGLAYVLVCTVLGVGLAITAVGIPLIAFSLYGARRLAGAHRWLAGRLLDEHVGESAPPRTGRGFYGRAQALLSDVPGWRAMAYLLLQFPAAVVQLYVVAFTWAWGLVAVTCPIQYALGWNETTTRDPDGTPHHHWAIHGHTFDTLPRQLLVCLGGVALLLLAPWAVTAVTLASRGLMRWLLTPHRNTERIRALERTRARAVDDAAATLRRIERDLHDGAQARLVTLSMQLTMVREAAPEGRTRELAEAAQATAKQAITELRELVRGIHPPVLNQGLDTALATLTARSAVPVDLRTDIGRRPTAAIESIAYFCTAELLTNVAKHSGASRARVEAVQAGDRLRLRIWDDGAGGARIGTGTGLTGLLDRVHTVDGRLEVDSPPGGPTVVAIDLPSHA